MFKDRENRLYWEVDGFHSPSATFRFSHELSKKWTSRLIVKSPWTYAVFRHENEKLRAIQLKSFEYLT